MDFSSVIMKWYQGNKRDLPWRRTGNPYLIWISEVILQQTRVEQGMAYYHRFTDRFPDIESLAAADEDEVLKIWQGLGYYTRARNLIQAAQTIYREHNRRFPETYQEIAKLKGVGDYSASAISSIAFREVRPVIDGNVIRVVSRVEGIEDPVNSVVSKKKIRRFMDHNINRDDPGTFNQAVMELGALVCKPKSPDCQRCPLVQSCFAYKNGMIEKIPVKTKGKLKINRYLDYLVIVTFLNHEPHFWIRKRNEEDIWKNLYDFPVIETGHYCSLEELRASREWEFALSDFRYKVGQMIEEAPYKLTHQQLMVRFIMIRSEDFSHPDYIKVNFEDLHKYPVSRMIENILKKIEFRPGIFLNFPD